MRMERGEYWSILGKAAFAVVGSGTPLDPWKLVWNMSTPPDYERARNYAVKIRVRDNNTGVEYDEWVIIEVEELGRTLGWSLDERNLGRNFRAKVGEEERGSIKS